MDVDTSGGTVPRLFGKTKTPAVTLCDRCGRICDAACRREALLRQARDRALLRGL